MSASYILSEFFCHLHKKSSQEKLELCCCDRDLLLLCVLLWKGCSFPLWCQHGEWDQNPKSLVCFECEFFLECFSYSFSVMGKNILQRKELPPKTSTNSEKLHPGRKNSNVLPIYLAIAKADCFGKTILRLWYSCLLLLWSFSYLLLLCVIRQAADPLSWKDVLGLGRNRRKCRAFGCCSLL